MSQSDAHRDLVTQVAKALESRFPEFSIIADLQESPGEPIPPLIDRYRPDLFAINTVKNSAVIAEAKTDNDVERTHTYNQIETYITYLERKSFGLFVLSVTGCRADFAKAILRFTRTRVQASKTQIEVYDGCDFWRLDPVGHPIWRLS